MANENQIQGGTSLDAIVSLLKLFNGTQQTTTGGTVSSSKQTELSQEAMAGLLRTALESNAGLASVTQGQRTAGLYNASTNQLLANDLLARLTARAAEAGATTTETRTTTPQVTTSGEIGNKDMLTKLGLALTAYQKLGKPLMTAVTDPKVKKVAGSVVSGAGEAADSIMSMFSGGGAATDLSNAMNNASFADNMSVDPSNAVFKLLGESFAGDMSTPAADFGSILSDTFAGFSADQLGADIPAGDYTVPTEEAINAGAGESGNFSGASGTLSNNGGTAGPSSSEILSEANSNSSDTTNLAADSVTTAGSLSAYLGSSGSNIPAMSIDPSSTYSQIGGMGSVGTYGEFAGEMSTAGGDVASSSGGPILGYIGPVMAAFNAPEAENGKDYRHAVGSAVLNYFGFGWASPLVHMVAEPALNASMDAGTESMGTFGAVLADPVGAPLSGQYPIDQLITSTLDPGNIFGGNPGGSTGAVAGAILDPVGAALGDTGVFSVVKDAINSIETSDPIGNAVGEVLGQGSGGGGLPGPGRVVCTELAFQGKISAEKYMQVLKPGVTLTGRVLLGYHLLGVPAVRRMRKDPKFVDRALPYVNAYLDYKLGKFSWTGFFIKHIGEPLCWCLSFFNKDPDYFQTLYPYRRNRKVA